MTVCFHEDRSLCLQGQSSRWPGSLANDSSNRAAGSRQPARRPLAGRLVKTFQRIIVPCRTFLLPLSVFASPASPPTQRDELAQYRKLWQGPRRQNKSFYRNWETFSVILQGKSHGPLWGLKRQKSKDSKDITCCACPFTCPFHAPASWPDSCSPPAHTTVPAFVNLFIGYLLNYSLSGIEHMIPTFMELAVLWKVSHSKEATNINGR